MICLKNILTNEKISIIEFEQLLNTCKEYYSINNNLVNDNLQIEIDKGEQKLNFYKNPKTMFIYYFKIYYTFYQMKSKDIFL